MTLRSAEKGAFGRNIGTVYVTDWPIPVRVRARASVQSKHLRCAPRDTPLDMAALC
jgi:hypothetical protein